MVEIAKNSENEKNQIHIFRREGFWGFGEIGRAHV